MSAAHAPQGIAGSLPALTLHALGIAVGPLNEHTAQLVLHNPVAHAAAQLDKAALTALGQQFLALAETLTEAPEARPQLVLPESARQGLVIAPDGAL